MLWRIGTMGFSYPDWSGVFYPRSLKPGEYLSFYARHFDALELDTTFYATPDPERVRRWAAAVPDSFRFAVKTPRTVTHDLPLDLAGDAMRDFVHVVRHFGDKLGVVLLQFGPSFTSRESPRLATFLGTLPKDLRFAVEFRDASWDSDETERMLRERNVCWTASHYVVAPMPLRVTADFLYLRWIGRHDRFEAHDRERIDVAPHLDWWRKEVDRAAPILPAAWGFFNNDYAGYSVATANRFKSMLGLPASTPKHERQGDLFG